MPSLEEPLTRVLPRIGSALWSRVNGPISFSSIAIRRRSIRKLWRRRKSFKRGWRAGRCGSGLTPRALSAVDEHRRRKDLRQFLHLATRLVPKIERDAGPSAALEKPRD